MVCAGTTRENPECAVIGSGDSGGPLVCLNESENRWDVAGITSWAFNCLPEIRQPSVFTLTTNEEINKWIKDTMEKNTK